MKHYWRVQTLLRNKEEIQEGEIRNEKKKRINLFYSSIRIAFCALGWRRKGTHKALNIFKCFSAPSEEVWKTGLYF